MLTATTPYIRPIGNGLVLKSIANLHDADRLIAFNAHSFRPEEGEMTRALILHHPATQPHHWLYIEDDATGQIVSSLCMIPWQWRYEDVILKSAEMGIVSTLESYRNRGLIRALDVRFKALLTEEAFDLSHIQGIPYFYRQFGYEYAMPLEAQWQVEPRSIPDVAESPYCFRRATSHDIPVLMQMYNDATAHLDISALRSAEVWRYLLENNAGTGTESEIWLMLNGDQQPVGYHTITLHGFGEGLIVSETSRLNSLHADALLNQLKATAIERNKPYIRLNLPVSNELVQITKRLGAHDTGTYAWQIHLPDVVRLLRKLTPVLERRIAASPFAGLSEKITLNLYREAFELCFERGKLIAVQSIGFSDGGQIRIPPLLLAPLLLGYRSREELSHMYPDLSIWGRAQLLVDVLFPKMDSFIFTNY